MEVALMLYFFVVADKAAKANPADGLLEVSEDVIQLLLVLEIFLTEDS